MLNVPKKLEKGDFVGIICPSEGVHPTAKHRVENAIKMLEILGYKVKLGKTIYCEDNYVSGSIEARLQDFHEMFKDESVKMIMPAFGGLCANHLLSGIDYELIRNNPKIFIGYSDITVLLYALYAQGNLATYYGPCAVTQFAEYPEILDYTLKSFLRAVSSDNKENEYKIESSDEWTGEFLSWGKQEDLTRPRKKEKNNGYFWMRNGVASGEALPSCIVSINHLAGTKYWIDPKDKILVLDLLLSPGEINYPILDASLTDLYNLGVFSDIKGLVLSRLCGFSEDESRAVYQRIKEMTQGTNYPIVCNFDIGHTDPINTIQYGSKLMLDSKKNYIVVKLYEKNKN